MAGKEFKAKERTVQKMSRDGLVEENLRTGKTKVYMRDDGLLDSSVYSLAVDSEGTLWAGNLTGISRYDTSADRFVPEQETGFMIGAILPEPDGTVFSFS